MDHFAGLDVSVKETSICIVNERTAIRMLRMRLLSLEHDCTIPELTIDSRADFAGRLFKALTYIPQHERLREHIRPNLPSNFNDRIGGDVVSSCRRPNSFRIRRVVEAIGLFLVGAKEREDPLHAFLIINQIDLFHPFLCEVELFRKILFR